MKKFVISILLAASLANAGGYSIIEPILKEVEGQIMQKIAAFLQPVTIFYCLTCHIT